MIEIGMPNELVICADDYAISRETSEVIRDLLVRHAINATTCLVESKTWEREAGALRAIADADPGVTIGLHLNLTERIGNPAVPAAIKSIPGWLGLNFLPVNPALEACILSSYRAQWQSFVECYGRPPDFIDGHHHSHLLKMPRRALFTLIRETKFSGWVRQCFSSAKRIRRQTLFFDPLSKRLCAMAQAAGVSTNPGFGGLRFFREWEQPIELWKSDLAAMASTGGLLMVHPGSTGSPQGTESIDQFRISEAKALRDPGFGKAIAEAGLRLAQRAATPDWS
jgi:chitin disaccharide deacetylase